MTHAHFIPLLFAASASLKAQAGCPLRIEKFNFAGINRIYHYPSSKETVRDTSFSVHIENSSGKDIREIRMQLGYFNAAEKLSVLANETVLRKNWKAGGVLPHFWMEPLEGRPVGWILLVKKLHFEDGLTWTADLHHVCYAESWRDKKHLPLTKLPLWMFQP